MALLEDVFGNGLGGPAAVVGAVVLGSLLLPAVAGAARPVVKTGIKGGIMAYGQWREALAGVGAIVNEAVAEARAELEAGLSRKTESGRKVEDEAARARAKRRVLEQSASSCRAAHGGSSRRVSFRGHVTGLSTAARKRLATETRVVEGDRTWRRARGRSGDRHSRRPSRPRALTPASLRRPTPMPSRWHGARYGSSTASRSGARQQRSDRCRSFGPDIG
jgi:hypothetical protein